MNVHTGDWVEVRSKEEILATLDANGRLDGLPLMPQMLKYCGQSFKIYKVAHKTCDTVDRTGGRQVPRGIHLDLRCDGQAYGGCQAACLLFWKEDWLKPIGEPVNAGKPAACDANDARAAPAAHRGCSEDDVARATSIEGPETPGDKTYQCQAVRLPYFTTALPWWRADQYVQDYRSGNVTLRTLFNGFIYSAYCTATRAYLQGLGRPGRWFYDWFQSLRGGIPYPRRRGTLLAGERAPVNALNLLPGDFVRVRSYQDILATLNSENSHRGLFFDAELVPYCGETYRVKARVARFVDEKTGRMRFMKTPAVILEGVWCRSRYSNHRMFCPRSIYSWWREEWLERIEEQEAIEGSVLGQEIDRQLGGSHAKCGGCEGIPAARRHASVSQD